MISSSASNGCQIHQCHPSYGRKSSNFRRPNSYRFTSLHAKGVFTISLFVLTESVSFCSAITKRSADPNNGFFGTDRPRDTTYNSPITIQYPDRISTEASHLSSAGSHRRHKKPQQSPCGSKSEECPSYSNERKNYYSSTFKVAWAAPQPVITHLIKQVKNFKKKGDGAFVPTVCQSTIPYSGNEKSSCNDEVKVSSQSCSSLDIPRGGSASESSRILADKALSEVVTTPFNIPLNGWKIIFQAVLTAMNVFCWLVPLRSKRISQNKMVLSMANSFSGGVFLSLAFGHLIPECIHGFDKAIYNEATPYMLVLTGYLLIFFVEKVAFDAHDILHEMEQGPLVVDKHDHSHSHESTALYTNGSNAPTSSVTTTNGGHAMTTDAGTTGGSSGRGAVILLGALAVHSILEMMALGLADSFGDCALLTLSIALHQPAESVALLVAFLKSGMSENQVIRYLTIFSCMGPVGVLLGMLVNEYASPIVDSIMLAIVAGTFVYVGATEVIPEEFEDSENKWKKFGALMAGIVSIFAITQYTMTLGAH